MKSSNTYKPFQANTLSLILQYSQNWLIPNEPQKHEKYETDRILTQKYVNKKYRRKYNLILKNITTLQNTYYKLLEQTW